MTGPRGGTDLGEELVEFVAREIQLRGLTGPAVMFLEASRPYRPLGSQAMVFFDPVLRGLFGGDMAEVQRVLADDAGHRAPDRAPGRDRRRAGPGRLSPRYPRADGSADRRRRRRARIRPVPVRIDP